MKKSELFKEIYKTVKTVNNSIGDNYDKSIIGPELQDEETDLKLSKRNSEFIQTALYWYSLRMSYVIAISLTELLSSTFTIDSDVNLNDFDTVESLVLEVDETAK